MGTLVLLYWVGAETGKIARLTVVLLRVGAWRESACIRRSKEFKECSDMKRKRR